MYKSILVPFFEADSARAAFGAAAGVARRSNAHIVAVHVRQRPMTPYVVYYPLGGTFPVTDDDALIKAEDDNAAALHALFDELCDQHKVGKKDFAKHTDDSGPTASWRDVKGQLPEAVGDIAASFDLTVLAARGENEGAFDSNLAEGVLFRSGRPLLRWPVGAAAQDGAGTVAVAWNGGGEAASAIAASLPLLKAAKAVKLITIAEFGARKTPLDDIAATLKLHGVEAQEIAVEAPKGEAAIDTLAHALEDAAADLVVMGAYSHSRWREAVLGGFTRRMLAQADVPVLMAR